MRDILSTYTFSAEFGTVQLAFSPIAPENVLGIWNATRGTKLYDPHVPGYGATFFGDTITLVDVDTTGHDDSDTLIVFYEGVSSSLLAKEQTLNSILTALSTLATNSALANLQNEIGFSELGAANSDSGDHTLIALTKRINQHLTTLESNGSGNGTLLSDILAELRDDVFVSQMVWEDPATHVFYREERVRSQDDGMITTTYTRLSDQVVVVSLPAGSVPVETSDVRSIEHVRWRATAGGTGFSLNDWLIETVIIDTTATGSLVGTFWYNLTTGSAIAAPSSSSITSPDTDALNGLVSRIGEVQASPTANTLLGRLKDLLTGIVLAAGTAVIGKVGIDQSTPGTSNAVSPIAGKSGVSPGAGPNDATTQRITIATDDSVHDKLGALTETAPAGDTSSSGLNGRMQRLAQRLTTLITNLGTQVYGSGTAAAAQRVTIATDDGLNTRLGEVQASPTSNTVLARLKDLLTGIVLSAGTATIGKVYAAFQTTKAITNANLSFSSSGNNTLVSGTTSQTVRAFRGLLYAAAPVTITIKDASAGSTLATVTLGAGGSFAFDCADSGEPLWVSASGGDLIASLSSAVAVTGFIQYTKS